jgi:hypothetical protein
MIRHSFPALVASSVFAIASCLTSTPALASDWMIISEEPDPAPHRSIYVIQFGESWIDHRLDEGADTLALEQAARSSQMPSAEINAQTISGVEVLQVFENAGGTNFIQYEVEFKCRDGMVRIPQVTAYDRAGKQEKSSAPQWMKVPKNWMGQAEIIACKWKRWEAAELAWQQRGVPKRKNKAGEQPATFASLGMEYLGDYAAWTKVVDAVWNTKWTDAKQPAYINEGTPEDLAKLKREGLARLANAKAIGAEQQKWSKISLAVESKAERMGGEVAKEMSSVGGLTEEQVVARWGVPQGLVESPGVRQLNYYWQGTKSATEYVAVDIMGSTGNGGVGKIGETSQPRSITVPTQCFRALFLQEGGALENAWRVYDFDMGCS